MIEKVKRDLILKTNPETNEQYWAPGVKTVYKPEEHDRVNAVLDILKGATTAEEVRKSMTSRQSTASTHGLAST